MGCADRLRLVATAHAATSTATAAASTDSRVRVPTRVDRDDALRDGTSQLLGLVTALSMLTLLLVLFAGRIA